MFGWKQRKRDLQTCRRMLHAFICKCHPQASSRRTCKALHFLEDLSPLGAAVCTSPACKGRTAFAWVILHSDCYGYASAEADRWSFTTGPCSAGPVGIACTGPTIACPGCLGQNHRKPSRSGHPSAASGSVGDRTPPALSQHRLRSLGSGSQPGQHLLRVSPEKNLQTAAKKVLLGPESESIEPHRLHQTQR